MSKALASRRRPGKTVLSKMPGVVGELDVFVISQDKPVERVVANTPHEILAHAVAAVKVLLVVQVDADGTR